MTKRKRQKRLDLTQVYVRDDLGHAWYYDPKEGKIRLVLADLKENDSDVFKENGYYCDGLVEGIHLLNEYGYITGIEYNDEWESEYFDPRDLAILGGDPSL